MIIHVLPYDGFFGGKMFGIFFAFGGFAKQFSIKIFFQGAVLMGMVHWVTIRYHANGHGALGYLGYHKFAKGFLQ